MATKRHFLQALLLAPITSLSTLEQWTTTRKPNFTEKLTIAAAGKQSESEYIVNVIGSTQPEPLSTPIPGRGHDCNFAPNGNQLVVFSRRPGLWFLVIDLDKQQPVMQINAIDGRHFYGHGCFSPDGRRFYATENDFDNGRGIIGVYDPHNAYQRVGEFESGGVGPHDITVLHDQTLLVANGGIETHPDFGREKLNLATMRSSLAVINSRTGVLTQHYALPDALQKMSMRHLATAISGDCFFACQYQGAVDDWVPLVGCLRKNGSFELWEFEQKKHAHENYITSIAVDPHGQTVATTSARAGAVYFWNAKTGQERASTKLNDCSGVCASHAGFHVGSTNALSSFSLQGDHLQTIKFDRPEPVLWDNHMTIKLG